MFYRQLTGDEKKRKCKHYQKHTGSCSHPNYKVLCCDRCIGYRERIMTLKLVSKEDARGKTRRLNDVDKSYHAYRTGRDNPTVKEKAHDKG